MIWKVLVRFFNGSSITDNFDLSPKNKIDEIDLKNIKHCYVQYGKIHSIEFYLP